MKELYKFCRIGIFFLTSPAIFPVHLFSQSTRTQTARANTIIDTYCHGFYESLPLDYGSTGTSYPLMIFLHGDGEIGDGSPSALTTVLRHGPPMLIDQGAFPNSFTVNGQNYEFIVISPQLNTWPPPPQEPIAVNDIIDYAIAHYRVDTTRIYLTGLSMGGGITWDYAGYTAAPYTKRLAAILPVAGASTPSVYRSIQMARYHLPVWATANQDDATVPTYYTTQYVHLLDSLGADPAPLMTLFPASGHGGWDATYGTPMQSGITENGLNVFQWMLEFQRSGDNVITGGIPLPVVLTNYQAVLSGPHSVTVSWSTASEENNKYFILQRSADGQTFNNLDTIEAANQPHPYSYTDLSPFTGANFYRLSQVDLDGKTTYFGVLKVSVGGAQNPLFFRVSPNPASGSIYLELTNPELGEIRMSLSDATGRIVKSGSYQKSGLTWNQSLDLSGLAAGNYFITITGNSIREVQEFIKK
jgi:pimeloyl-ACP methyl ester carboxylesterase